MLVYAKKPFYIGLLMLVSFIIMAWIMLLPIFPGASGQKLTSLQFADEVFNSLSKGSSNFFPEVRESIKSVHGKEVSLAVDLDGRDLASIILQELMKAGVTDAVETDGVITFKGNLERILAAATQDSADLFANDGNAISSRYNGASPLQISRGWWHLLQPCVKLLQMQGAVADAKVVDTVVKKAIEPANNFYGISDANAAENILLILGMLTFYVLYAIWYGFAIYNLFDGLGFLGKHDAKAA